MNDWLLGWDVDWCWWSAWQCWQSPLDSWQSTWQWQSHGAQGYL